MKLVKIFANKNFKNIEFNEGFNVVLAVINDQENKKDTHNLGKTYLTHVIDFILLGDKRYFENDVFEDVIFYGELKLNNGKYLLLKRAVDPASKISFKLNEFKSNDFNPPLSWDFENIPFERSKKKLNEFLNFDVVKNYDYRKSITYFLRTQQDYLDVYKLNKFKSRHIDWKPFVFELLGYDSNLIVEKYILEDEIKSNESSIQTLEDEAKTNPKERDRLAGLLDIKQQELTEAQDSIDRFNFFKEDSTLNKDLIESLDNEIQLLNTERYRITYEINKIKESLANLQTNIKTEDLEKLYKETGLYFPEILKKEFANLIEFNTSISQERKVFLDDNLKLLQNQHIAINNKIKTLESEKSQKLTFLTEKDSYEKFKFYQKKLSESEADIYVLKQEIKNIDRINEIKDLNKEIFVKIDKITKEIESAINTRRHANINKIFNNIIHDILDSHAIISLKQNNQGNVEFGAEYQRSLDAITTAEEQGTSYKKLLCMAFDLALLIHYSQNSFFRYVYHDGILEGLDDRVKISLLEKIKEICSQHNIQYILSSIDSDIPFYFFLDPYLFTDEEICL